MYSAKELHIIYNQQQLYSIGIIFKVLPCILRKRALARESASLTTKQGTSSDIDDIDTFVEIGFVPPHPVPGRNPRDWQCETRNNAESRNSLEKALCIQYCILEVTEKKPSSSKPLIALFLGITNQPDFTILLFLYTFNYCHSTHTVTLIIIYSR